MAGIPAWQPEMALGATNGLEAHAGEVRVASAGRGTRARGSVSDRALEVGPALARLGGKDAHGGEGRSGGEVRKG